MTDRDVERLQDALDHVTTNPETWDQRSWCALGPGFTVDLLSDRHLTDGSYHGFPLSRETIDVLGDLTEDGRIDLRLPVDPCGTAYCLAGHICVRNGYTFVEEPHDAKAWSVVPTANLQEFLRATGYRQRTLASEPGVTAAELLNIPRWLSHQLWWGGNSLVDLWALGFVATDGRLRLPDRLSPSSVFEYGTPESVRGAVLAALRRIAAQREHFPHERENLERAIVVLGPQLVGAE